MIEQLHQALSEYSRLIHRTAMVGIELWRYESEYGETVEANYRLWVDGKNTRIIAESPEELLCILRQRILVHKRFEMAK
jgi:hypothetical protein